MDAKWQFSHHPVTYTEFVKDSAVNRQYVNYKEEIKQVRNMNKEYQKFMDALNSIKYNPLNKFNIAYQYYYHANQIQIDKNTVFDSTLLPSLTKSMEYFDSAYSYFAEFKLINQAIYRSKKTDLRNTFKTAKKDLKGIGKIPSSYNNRLNRETDKIFNLDARYSSIIVKINDELMRLPNSVSYHFDTERKIDSLEYDAYLTEMETEKHEISEKLNQLKKLAYSIDTLQNIHQGNTDSVFKPFVIACTTLTVMDLSMDQMGSFETYRSCTLLNKSYWNYKGNYAEKEKIHQQLFDMYGDFQDRFDEVYDMIQAIMDSYSDLSKLSGDNTRFVSDAEIMNSWAGETYQLLKNVLLKLKEENES